jgi:hypothetical protein
MSAAVCPLCGHRKAKRACPAKSASICSVCCGTKRLVEIDCPGDCVYLTGAHAPAYDGRESDRRADLVRVAPQLERLSQDEAAVFFYLLAGMVRISAHHRDADDAQWQQAVTALRKTFETRDSGLVYEHAAEGFRAQALVREMQQVVHPPGQDRPVADERSLLAALRAVDGALAATLQPGASPTAFLETARRLTARLVEHGPRPAPEEPAPAPRILEP